MEDKLPSLSRPTGFQPGEEEAEQDAPPPSHASSVTSERGSLTFCDCDGSVQVDVYGTERCQLKQTIVLTKKSGPAEAL